MGISCLTIMIFNRIDLGLNGRLDPVTPFPALCLRTLSLPLITVLSFFVTCALKEGVAFVVVVLGVVVVVAKSDCAEAGKASGCLAHT
jgi:hypothetical protein